MSHHRAREAEQAAAYRDELTERIASALPSDRRNEPIRGLHFSASSPTERVNGVSRPTLCVIAQGAKEIYLGDDCFRYDPAYYLLAVVSLPVVIQIAEASMDKLEFMVSFLRSGRLGCRPRRARRDEAVPARREG